MIYFLQDRFTDLAVRKHRPAHGYHVRRIYSPISSASGWVTAKFAKKHSSSSALCWLQWEPLSPSQFQLDRDFNGAVHRGSDWFVLCFQWALEHTSSKKNRQVSSWHLHLAGAGAGAIGAYIGGPIADSAGYVLLMSIYGVLFIASIIPVIFVKEKRK